ncbi:MAG: hypothetical protein ABIG66_02235 [Candidatus Kerfeldbacteria bacterium]
MRRNPQRGFSLLETVLAIGVILFGVISIMTLSTTSFVSGQIMSNEFVAANLAREGMEMVRGHRDTNWLRIDSNEVIVWNEGLFEESLGVYDYSGVATGALAIRPYPAVLFDVDAFDQLCNGAGGSQYDCSAIWFNKQYNYYFQTISPTFDPSALMVEKTEYQRLIMLNPICRANADETDEQVITAGTCAGLGAYSQAGIDVIVEVRYPGKGERLSYTLEEHIYDWKY